MTIRASIVGGSGYVGGELLRLLLFHPEIQLAQVVSHAHAGRYVHEWHPNLRNRTNLRFSSTDDLEPVDFLFLALPHREASESFDRFFHLAERGIDCSADFRLRDPAAYERWYGNEHPHPEYLSQFVYGLPERHREQLREARWASGVGCNATATILGLAPLADAGILDHVVVDLKVGSSEAGGQASSASHHPERAGAVRVYSTTGHRHLAEVQQELGVSEVTLTATAIEMVRGVHMLAHAYLSEGQPPLDGRGLWRLYRDAYQHEPFVRLVSARSGMYRYPEPKILSGSNFCDIGFSIDDSSRHLIVISALDNLMKGAAGTAVQTMNVMLGLDETSGLRFPGLHPI